MKKHLPLWIWSSVSFVVSLLSSSTGGRALWCDEILRINGQHYTLEQLFAFKHLHDFCTQTPTGYLFLRPFQLLLGYEFGGNLVASASAAIITACVLLTVRRFNDGRYCRWPVAAVVALNPLLIYYGSELSFYGMFAAAFAVAFALVFTLDDETGFRGQLVRYIGFAVAGALFITFHFAGMFVWAGFAAAVTIDRWMRGGFKAAFNRGLLLFIPMAVNIPMYLGAEGKAIHLGTQKVDWGKLATLPGALWHYLYSLFPSFTGGSIVGVAVFAIGVYFLLLRDATRRAASYALSATLAILFFLGYSGLHDYVPPVARYWVYALTPVLFIVAMALEGLAVKRRVVAFAFAGVILAANLVADSVMFFAEGRNYPYARFQAAVPSEVPAVVYVNHYETRFFGGYYALLEGVGKAIPSYWEQGEKVRAEGLKLLNRLSPLSPVYIQDDAQEKMSIAAGWTPGKRVDATMPPTFPLAKKLNLNPEPANAAASTLRLFVPTVEELIAESEAKGEARFLPGKGWRLLQSPPKKADQPFTPFLYLAPGAKAELKVYVPKALRGKDLTLHGFFARGKAAAQPFARKLQTSNSELQTSSGFVTIPFDGALDGCYFLYPEVK